MQPKWTTKQTQSGRWGMLLALALPLLQLNRASGQEENMLGYRHEFYREDADRMRVDTDSVAFDVGLLSKIRLTGNVVIDAISGATPVGAPQQSKWPFPNYQTYYNAAYQPAYTMQFNQYIKQNQIYVDTGYETAQQLTNAATQFARTVASTIASNTAAGSLRSLTNNPSFRNTTVPLTYLHDRRVAFGLGLPTACGDEAFVPSLAYSREGDYLSWGGAMNYSRFFNNKNTTLNLGWAHDSDSVRNDKFVWVPKVTDDLLLGVVQLITPKSYLTLNCGASFERGYLSDPYRGVMAEANFPQLNPSDPALLAEKRPRHRNSELVYASWTQFVTPLSGSLEASYRLFHDSYGEVSHTVGLDWHQKLGKRIVLSPTFRCYVQGPADFYYVLVPDYHHLPDYYSSDYRLSQFMSLAGGLSLTWRIQEHVSLDVSYLRYVMQGLDGVTSQSAYPSANVFSVGLRLWF